MSCCGFQDVIGVSLEESQLITSNQLYTDLNNNILINSNINSNFTIYSCNQLSNLIQPQLDERSNLIYIDSNLNTIIHLTAQNVYYPIYGEQKEIRFHTAENEYITKINQEGGLEVYHPLRAIPVPIDYPAAWWNVEEKLTFLIQDGIGLRFDITNLQAGSGIGTITNEAEATAAAVASGAGLVGLGGITGAAATTIAGGDYGSVALGVAGGALFSVLGYLSYQAQVGCNLSNLGFSNQFSNVNSNMSNANLLLTSNLYSISRAQGFINCNILSQQYINDLKVSSLNLNNGNLTNFNTINGNTGIFNTFSTTNNTNEAIPSRNSFGGIGDKIIIKTGTSTTYPYSIGIENKALWISGEDNINFYNRGIKSLSLTSNNSTQIFGELLCNSNLKLNNTNISNIFVASNVLSNINLNQGFLNSNTIAQQYLNSININELKIANTNISNIFVASNVLSNININQGFINSNITNQQYISNLKTDNLILNNGNISNINGISTNELIASGKIKQNGILLDNIYLTSNHLYNLAFNYTTERQYPSKLFTSSSIEGTATLLNKLVYKQILFLDTTSISYGSGFYEVYSSSTYDNGITNKDKLFNFNTTETTTSSRWAINLYNSGTGNYQADNSIDGAYFGDWIIIKLPQEILLTRYRIYQRTDFLTKAPAEWKCYGSKDGIIFNEITEASQLTRLTSYSSGFYEKTLNSSFTTQYQYIGFCFNKLLSTSGQTDLSFAELQIFGKEIISNSIVSNIYATSNAVKYLVRNEMNDVGKRQSFIIEIPSSSVFVDATTSTTFYKWDLDLTKYTRTQIIPSIPITNDLIRIFRIRFWYVPSYFGSYLNGEPYVNSYEVYMSNKSNPVFNRPETAGINIFTIGDPENVKLNNILPNNLFLLKNYNSNFNYLTIISRQAPCSIYCIIEDLLY